MSEFCVKCRFCKVCPAVNGLWEAVRSVVSTEGYNKLEALLNQECMLRVDEDATIIPKVEDKSDTIEFSDEDSNDC